MVVSEGQLLGRGRDLGALRTALDRREASWIQVTGLRGVGKSALVRAACADFPTVFHCAPPLPDPHQRAYLARTLAAARPEPTSPVPGAGDAPAWEDLFRAAMASTAADGRPTVLVVDDAHRWSEARSRFAAPLDGVLAEARARGQAFHVVLVAPEAVRDATPPGADGRGLTLRLLPLTFRAAAPRLPGSGAGDRLRAYSVFGGLPCHLRFVDPDASLSTNLRRLVLGADAPLADAGIATLEAAAQVPSRYAAILSALSAGEADWGTVHAGVPDLTAGGQVAPYLNRLEELGLVEVRRSLDAGPRARGRRYRIVDPFFALWYRFVLPHRGRLAVPDGDDLLAGGIRPGLEAHLATVFPEICRQYMRYDVMESLGANARECGSLWGPGYDIPVAGTLATGAPFYGQPLPVGPEAGSPLGALDRQVRQTRYGFGRERRLRVLFTTGDFPPDLEREAARRHDVVLVRPEALAGE